MKQPYKEKYEGIKKELASKKRELKIETALEKVRARTMAMQKSEELAETSLLLFQQFKKLGETSEQISIGIFNEEKNIMELYSTLHGVQWKEAASIDLEEPLVMKKIHAAWKKKKKSLVIDLTGSELKKYNKYRKSLTGLDYKEKRWVIHVAFFSKGVITFSTTEPLTKETIQMLERFATVFNGTYTRFLDLQKAEAQEREAEIEVALERIRAESMGMHKSDELIEIVRILEKQLSGLGIDVSNTSILTDFEITNPKAGLNNWLAVEGQPYLEKFHIPPMEDPISKILEDNFNQGIDFYTEKYSKQAKNCYFRKLFKYSDFKKIPKERQELVISAPGWVRVVAIFKNSILILQRFNLIEFTIEEKEIFKRFGKVFEQAYTRFLDLQKAEAQAMEAQIEAALERVRSRTMGMQKSEELKEVIQIVYEQFIHLNIHIEHTGFLIDYKASDDMHIWLADRHLVPSEVTIPWFDSPPNNSIKEAKEKGQDFFTYHLTFEEKNKFYQDLFKFVPDVPEETLEYYFNCPGLAGSGVLLENIGLYIENFSGSPYSDEENAALMRFGKVFQQTYTRFLDLQKAEAQAREAQIEAALEKVRSRSLAMHHTGELSSLVGVVFEKLRELNIATGQWDAANIIIFKEGSRDLVVWIANQSEVYLRSYFVPFINNPILSEPWDAIDSGAEYFASSHSSEVSKPWFKWAFEYSDYKYFPDDVKTALLGTENITSNWAFAKHSALLVVGTTGKLLSTQEADILKRFAKVFEQAYTRFLDLQKAEAQAREAKIEVALERVRSKTMAMHNSEDVSAATATMFIELEKLGVELFRCGISIFNINRTQEVWSVTNLDEEKSVKAVGLFQIDDHPFWKLTFDEWLNKKEFLHYYLEGKEKEDYVKILNSTPNYLSQPIKKFPDIHFQVYYFREGAVFTNSLQAPSEWYNQIMKRFVSVFSLTFRRFLDLQKAEAQAREATRQASLDRVRGQIASMRSTEDLNRITPLMWHELTALGVPFIRCGVFIIDESNAITHVYLSSPDGHSLAVLNLPFNSSELSTNSVENWRKGMVYHQHWNKEEFINWTKSMMEMGQIQNSETYQGAAAPPESLDLHFVPFTQGMLYVGNTEPLSEDAIDLVKSLAEAFSIAYARYEDFTKLEHAKQSIENTLTELKATQKQLVQSEKMASLGELTAGIAHEIQNPLNFVNNFSEINTELIDELQEEAGKGNLDEVKEIAKNIKENAEKINHHGKRAGDIVKGMLQHSRSSTGVKEPTDINALADEYLRLSYHGLRAKDKSFNATMKTNFDESLSADEAGIGKINIIPQDIGRVLLNLYNNAFYACTERSRSTAKEEKDENLISREPTVSVTTKKSENHVIITVSDNGNGIPQKIVNKIFQPFFTTKPTGQGTGLGLSLSFDIVKAHGGEIKVETKEGEARPDDPVGRGSKFIIQLPIN